MGLPPRAADGRAHRLEPRGKSALGESVGRARPYCSTCSYVPRGLGFLVAAAVRNSAVAPGCLLEFALGAPGVVAVDVIKVPTQRGVVTGIAEHNRPQRPVVPGDAQHRHIVIHRAQSGFTRSERRWTRAGVG